MNLAQVIGKAQAAEQVIAMLVAEIFPAVKPVTDAVLAGTAGVEDVLNALNPPAEEEPAPVTKTAAPATAQAAPAKTAGTSLSAADISAIVAALKAAA